MNLEKVEIKKLPYNSEDHIYISIGNKCLTAIVLKKLSVRVTSLPFDYIPTRPDLILKYIESGFNNFLPVKNKIINDDGVWFGHFFNKNMSDNEYLEMKNTFQRRCKRLIDIFNKNKKIVLVYTALGDIYNELNLRYENNYDNLVKLYKYLTKKFNSEFTIIAFHTNKYYNYDKKYNIINFTINVDELFYDDKYSQKINYFYGNIFSNVLKTLINGDDFRNISYTKSEIDNKVFGSNN